MRTIREMLANDEKVWVYFDSKETWEKFVEMACSEGFHFGDLPVEKWAVGFVVAVHSNGDMGHLSLFIWCMSFSNCANQPRKIEFRKYIDGEEEYLCEESHIKQWMII